MSETTTDNPKDGFGAVLAAYLSKNTVAPAEIEEVTARLRAAYEGAPAPAGRDAARQLTPKEIRESIQPDTLLCFENNKRYVQLKRPLAALGLTPTEYRRRWGLPLDYPMTAPAYSEKRRQLALASGLGRKKAD